MWFGDTATTLFVLAAVGLMGLVTGCVLGRLSLGDPIGKLSARIFARCQTCGHALTLSDCLPLVGWFASKGACRYCGSATSARQPLAELVCAGVFLAIAMVYGISVEAFELMAFAALLLFVSLTDLDRRTIPNECIVLALAIRAAYLVGQQAFGLASPDAIVYYVASGLGIATMLLIFALVVGRISARESLGGGDLKLYLVAGFYFGWRQTMFLVFASCLIGVLAAVVETAGFSSSNNGRLQLEDLMSTAIPFGPAIAVACVVTMLFGDAIACF